MLNISALEHCLKEIGLQPWSRHLIPMLETRLSKSAHGDFERWQQAVQALERSTDPDDTKQQLLRLSPWRKGPFELNGVHIDSEWRCDFKWARLENHIAPLTGRHVLDVGCGNGYYALRMREAGAAIVIGIDPTPLYVMQFLAAQHFLEVSSTFVVPVRLHELPLPARKFDTSFSMGVLYHQRAPIDHLRQLRDTLRPGGQLVLETLCLPGDEALARTPEDRYARMKNVWLLPTVPELKTWLHRSGFKDTHVIDATVTTTAEQRSTEWMSFESLAEALDPDDAGKTVEGWPVPMRVALTALAP